MANTWEGAPKITCPCVLGVACPCLWDEATCDGLSATIRDDFFAECHGHSAKDPSSSTLGKQDLLNTSLALILCRVLYLRHSTKFVPSTRWHSTKKVTVMVPSDDDRAFAECYARLPSVGYSRHSEKSDPMGPVLISMPSARAGTRQRVVLWAPTALPLPSVMADTRQLSFLC